jgi:hypothetical protein
MVLSEDLHLLIVLVSSGQRRLGLRVTKVRSPSSTFIISQGQKGGLCNLATHGL